MIEIVKYVKQPKDKSYVSMLIAENGFLCDEGLKEPKLVFTFVHKVGVEKAKSAKFFLDINQATKLMHNLRLNKADGSVIKSFKGTPKGDGAESRILDISRTVATDTWTFKLEVMDGQVKGSGIVSPVRGAKATVFSFVLSNDEALELSYRINNELVGWRSAVQTLKLMNPDRYNELFHKENNNNNK